tara:strand:- start:54 stop:347 length:294 start_codon:yes stop_codon:yes gene_type:complete
MRLLLRQHRYQQEPQHQHMVVAVKSTPLFVHQLQDRLQREVMVLVEQVHILVKEHDDAERQRDVVQVLALLQVVWLLGFQQLLHNINFVLQDFYLLN